MVSVSIALARFVGLSLAICFSCTIFVTLSFLVTLCLLSVIRGAIAIGLTAAIRA